MHRRRLRPPPSIPRGSRSPRPPHSPRDAHPLLGPGARRGWALLALSIAAYALAGLVMGQPFHEGARALREFDLRIYRTGVERILHGVGLYARPIRDGLGFTYPPFAALVLAPLALGSMRADALAVTALNVVLLVWLLRRTLCLPVSRTHRPVGRTASRSRAWGLAAGIAAGVL